MMLPGMRTRPLSCSTISPWRRTPCMRLRCRSTHSDERKPADLLGWATGNNLLYEHLPVELKEHPQYGRCLIATEDIEADTVILSVCTDKVFMSQAEDELEMHWAAEMALRLLQERHASRSSSNDNWDGSETDCTNYWKPWIDSLPQNVVTPVEFTTEEVEQLVIPSTVQAVLNMRQCLADCYSEVQMELLQLGCGWQDFLWAVQVLHSRCFYDPGSRRHLAVPGIDMANHSSSHPNATVRMLHSPGACQGLSALEEVAPAVAQAASSSYFQLLAGPDGIRAGEEVCITYGGWPAEPFLLLFGFVPQPNPHDSLTVFSSVEHMASCYAECLAEQLAKVLQNNINAGHHVSIVCLELVNDESFFRVFQHHVQLIQQQQILRNNSEESQGLPAFVDFIVNTCGVDARLKHALEIIYEAVGHAARHSLQQEATGVISDAYDSSSQVNYGAVVQHLRLSMRTLLQFRLMQLHKELQHSCLILHQQRQLVASVDNGISNPGQVAGAPCDDPPYKRSALHAGLIEQYCSTKAALAQRLAGCSNVTAMVTAGGASIYSIYSLEKCWTGESAYTRVLLLGKADG